MSSFPRMLSMDVHVKTVNILPLAEHAQKFVQPRLSVRLNHFLVCAVCAKIISKDAQLAHAIILENLKNTNLKCKFLL
jgi:hypothetical protein